MSRGPELHVETGRCIRCGACRAACPGVFDLVDEVAAVVRKPDAAERPFADAARWICPTDAIRGVVGEPAPGASSPSEEALFGELATGAERVRWSLGDVRWNDIDAARAPRELRSVVREMAFSESATYSATQRFLEAFFDDLDFSKWISVWFYEETRHPHVLAEWLRRVGEPVPPDLEVKGRVSTPFMRSALGTLVTNVVSEITAAYAYRCLAATSPEPILADLAWKIAGDEARHAATFYRFAARHLAAASGDAARRDRARGLEVLQAWLGGAPAATTHPVAEMIERLEASETDYEALGLGFTAVRTRIVRVVGLLLDIPLQRPDDVGPALRELLTRRGSG